MTARDRFVEFFAEANDGAQPYPWQCELVERVADTGKWPDIAAPTGAGKSAVIEAHVFLGAERAAGRLAVRPPRRLILVSPRRVLVDDQFDRAVRLAGLLTDAVQDGGGSALEQAAAALLSLQTAPVADSRPRPLLVWTLRGGLLLDNGWRLDPAACQVICATPLMWGSRLLLRGYGASRASRNLEAGLLGHDAVAIVDEAHLHRRLVETARAISSRASGSLGLQVVAMSATQATDSSQLGLSERDLADDALRRRVRAVKRIELVEVDEWGREVEREVVEQARAAAGTGTVGVFVNEVPSALHVAAALADHGHTVELVCGRLRPADLARLRDRRPRLLSPAGDPEVDFLVTTQSLEVGVDLDLPAMITVLASASALAQRAGRLNRSGRLAESTLRVVAPMTTAHAARSAQRGAGPYSSEELADARAWLTGLHGTISPEAVTASELPLPARPVLPMLRRADLDTLSMTSDVQSADPDPDLYLQDPEEALPEVFVIARRHLELDASVVRAALVACPPRQHELARLRPGKTLNRVAAAVADQAWVITARDGVTAAVPLNETDSLDPGDTLVVPDGALICTAGVVGLDEHSGRTGPLDDVLAETQPGAARDSVIALPVDEVAPIVAADPIVGTRVGRQALAEVLDAHREEALAGRMRRHRRLSELELSWCAGDDGVQTGLLVTRDMRVRADQITLTVPSEPVSVDAHQADVEHRLSTLLHALSPDPGEMPTDELLVAARTHDEGKRHPRFQRRMGADDVPLAKPRPGHIPDRGDGWRHEQLSAAFAAHASAGNALIVTLVAGHHGHGRLLFDRRADDLLDGWLECPEPVAEWVARLYGPMGEYELLRAAAQDRYGVHGLAWLEALLRCADMQISREGR
jgi:CRISPR-associated endonuclease/helicase Cas3